MTAKLDISIIACSVFRPEIEHLQGLGQITLPVSYVDSKLHMNPDELRAAIQSELEVLLVENDGVILVIGDCHSKMQKFAMDSPVVRVKAINCGDMLLGKQHYKELIKQNAFLMFPEWTARWRVIFKELADTCPQCGLDFLRDAHDKLVYLDTGITAVPNEELSACSSELGLPWESIPVAVDHFTELIDNAMEKLKKQIVTTQEIDRI